MQSALENAARELMPLIQHINRTYAASQFGTGTLADALAERGVLKLRYNAYRELVNRATRSEIKFPHRERRGDARQSG